LAEQPILSVSVVTNLDNAIRRIELRSEQLIIHLRSMRRAAPGAKQIQSVLLVMLLLALKRKRQQLEDELSLHPAA
jgi:hypothetical protein